MKTTTIKQRPYLLHYLHLSINLLIDQLDHQVKRLQVKIINSKNINMSNLICYICQESEKVVGHDTKTCPKVQCKSCWQKGHILQNCPKFGERFPQKPKFLKNIAGSKEFLERKKQRFNRTYTQGKELGEGGFGTVYDGVSTQFGRHVAIKRVSKNRFSKSQNKYVFDEERVPLEYKLLSKVQSVKGVIHLHDFYQLQDENIYVMEKPSKCKDLSDYIHDNHPLSEKAARKLIKQIIKMVNGCHKNGVFHRDIKPTNFLVDGKGRVYLIDFGCGLEVREEGYSSSEFWGTKDYFPPEVHNRRTYHSETATVWSLGILIYEIMTDNVPFHDKISIQYNEVPYQPKFSIELQDIINKCLKKYPSERISLEDLLNHKWLKKQTEKRKYEDFSSPDNQMQTDCQVDAMEPEAKKQKYFKDQITMKTGFIFPKPVPAFMEHYWVL